MSDGLEDLSLLCYFSLMELTNPTIAIIIKTEPVDIRTTGLGLVTRKSIPSGVIIKTPPTTMTNAQAKAPQRIIPTS